MIGLWALCAIASMGVCAQNSPGRRVGQSGNCRVALAGNPAYPSSLAAPSRARQCERHGQSAALPSEVQAGLLALVAVLSALLAWRVLALQRRNQALEGELAETSQALAQRSSELEAATHQLAALTDLDGLTGVANQRKLESALETALRDALAMEAHLALLLIDVDQFKQYNDAHGHLLGDERLRAIAERLSGWVGPGELLARTGGEEFAMLMPGSSIDVARERAEAIRRDAHQIGRDGEHSTLSIGIAELRLSKVTHSAQLLQHAHLALHRAKHAGRDRVEAY